MPNTLLNTGRVMQATSNPQTNIQQVTPNNGQTSQMSQQISQASPNNNQINPITIPIQIQPQIANPNNNNIQPINNIEQLQANPVSNSNNINTISSPQNNNRQNPIDFDQIYSSYKSQFGSNAQTTTDSTSQVKKTSIGTTIVTPTASPNTIKGQYQSAYADTFNSLLSAMLEKMNELESGNFYDPTKDMALRVASEYAANSALESMAGSGILNSSMTAERVSRVVSQLIPQYEQKAYDRQMNFLSQLANTAQLVMGYDSQQFEYWKDAKDREFQEKEFDFNKKMKELENAWKRVDELGYVDNESSALLGVKVGTLSKEAREAKEQREFELKKMQEQAQLEYENNKALYELRAELDRQQSQVEFEYDKQLQELQSKLNRQNTEYEYQLNQKYGSSSSSSSSKSKTNISTYSDIIESRWTDYDSVSKKYRVTGNNSAWYYIKNENQAGKMSDNDALALIAKYGIENPVKIVRDNLIVIMTESGGTSSFTINKGTTKKQLLDWGNSYGVDLSEYIA